MRDGICPKCGSEDVYSGAEVRPKSSSTGLNALPIRGSILGGVFNRTAELDNYVCTNCGYVESYINDNEDLQEIAERWPRVRR